jgi:tetratricopeptide (TPR) repeat protein
MAKRPGKTAKTKRREFSVPLLILLAFCLGAGTSWLILRVSSGTSPKPAIENFGVATAGQSITASPAAAANPPEPPDVSQLSPADAARTLGNWNYDQKNWTAAVEHYQQAIARGSDNPDVRTDLGNCFRFRGQPEKALEQYEIAQKENPMHENSLLNQISLFAQVLHDHARAEALAREFVTRFPQSPQAKTARELALPAQNPR